MEEYDRSDYEFDDDESVQTVERPQEPQKNVPIIDTTDKKMYDKIWRKTDLSLYDSSRERRISPEQDQKEWEQSELNERFSNPEFGQIVALFEKRLGREINYEEFDYLCQHYAIERAYTVARLKAGKFVSDEEIQINPLKVRQFYKMLINNEPLETSYRNEMRTYEQQMIGPIEYLLDQHKRIQPEDIEVDVGNGKRVNIRHKGKVKLVGANNDCKYIRIDNEEDVKLLKMKYRQDWLDKRYPDQVKNGEVVSDGGRAEMEFE